MAVRVEVAKRLKVAYRSASKAEKGRVLDSFCATTGLSRSTARRYLTSDTIGNRRVWRLDKRKCRPTRYSARSKEFLRKVWILSGCQCGKYLAASMRVWLDALQAHGELTLDRGGYTEQIRAELLSMSPATIDRYLAPVRKTMKLKGISTTKPGVLLRNSITIRKAGDEVEAEPGFFEIDTVAHCGPTLKGEFVRTLTFTDVYTGWVHLEAIKNNARKHILQALENAQARIPFLIQALDCDNGSEFINHQVVQWVQQRDIYFTRSRPYRKNDQANVESKNNHVVRKYGFYYRYDTNEQLKVLCRLWDNVCLRMNLFTPTRKPISWSQDTTGRRKRVYDQPATPLDRLLAAGVLSPKQVEELTTLRDSINPAELSRDIIRDQHILTSLAKQATQKLTMQIEQQKTNHQSRLQGGITKQSA